MTAARLSCSPFAPLCFGFSFNLIESACEFSTKEKLIVCPWNAFHGFSLPLPQQRFRPRPLTDQSDQRLVLGCLSVSLSLFVLSFFRFLRFYASLRLAFCLSFLFHFVLSFRNNRVFFVFSVFVFLFLSFLFLSFLFCFVFVSHLILSFWAFFPAQLLPGFKSAGLGTVFCRVHRSGYLAVGRGSGWRTGRLRSVASPQYSHSVGA
eukprot:COSAG02_NODE_990_length_15413_cov_24.707457_2_plen_206_part_00